MPVILAVNGTVEPYHPRPDGRRGKQDRSSKKASDSSALAVEEEPEEAGTPDGLPPELGFAALAAQSAYGQALRDPVRKPAVLARDIMSVPVHVVTPDTTLAAAWALMKARKFRHLPVINGERRLVGIVSDRDLLRSSSVLDAAAPAISQQQPIAAIMTASVLTATPTTDVRELAGVMLTERISALPVLDHDRRPVGIVTISDLLRAVVARAPLELWT